MGGNRKWLPGVTLRRHHGSGAVLVNPGGFVPTPHLLMFCMCCLHIERGGGRLADTRNRAGRR